MFTASSFTVDTTWKRSRRSSAGEQRIQLWHFHTRWEEDMCYQAMQRHEENINTRLQRKEVNLERLQTVQLQLYGVLEKANTWRQ